MPSRDERHADALGLQALLDVTPRVREPLGDRGLEMPDDVGDVVIRARAETFNREDILAAQRRSSADRVS